MSDRDVSPNNYKVQQDWLLKGVRTLPSNDVKEEVDYKGGDMTYRVTKRTYINGHLVKQTSTQRGQAHNLNRKVKPATLVKYDEAAHILRATQAALNMPVAQLPPAKPKTRPAADYKPEVKVMVHPLKTEAQVMAMIRRYAELCRPDQQLLQKILQAEIERELTRFPHLTESFQFARQEVVK